MADTTKQLEAAALGSPPGISEEKRAKIRGWAAQPQTQARWAAWWAGLSHTQRRRVADAARHYYSALATGKPERCAAAGAALLATIEGVGT